MLWAHRDSYFDTFTSLSENVAMFDMNIHHMHIKFFYININ